MLPFKIVLKEVGMIDVLHDGSKRLQTVYVIPSTRDPMILLSTGIVLLCVSISLT